MTFQEEFRVFYNTCVIERSGVMLVAPLVVDMDFFAGWLPLAAAYFEKAFCEFDPGEPFPAGYTIGHRMFDLR